MKKSLLSMVAIGALAGCSSIPKDVETTHQPLQSAAVTPSLTPVPANANSLAPTTVKALNRVPTSDDGAPEKYSCHMPGKSPTLSGQVLITISRTRPNAGNAEVEFSNLHHVFGGEAIQKFTYPALVSEESDGTVMMAEDQRGYVTWARFQLALRKPNQTNKQAPRSASFYGYNANGVQFQSDLICCPGGQLPVSLDDKGKEWTCPTRPLNEAIEDIKGIVGDGKLSDRQKVNKIREALKK